MSVTFTPYINHQKPISPDLLTWTASWVQHCRWEDLPEKFKTLGDMDQNLWNLGPQHLQVWRGMADQLGLQLHDDWTYKKIWVDNVPWKVVLVATGEDKTHRGQEMQLANSNAHALCSFLGIEDSGSMNPIALLKIIEKAKNRGNASEFTRNYEDSDDNKAPLGIDNGSRMIDFGLSESKMHQYLLTLEHLCDHCIRHECDISWG